MAKKFGSRTGSSMLEFTMVGIPVIFALFCMFELARCMWTYHSMSYAINEAARYAVVHGKGCTTGTNACSVTVATVANQITSAGIALSPANLSVSFKSASGTVNCNPISSCSANNSQWPPSGDNVAGMDITISGNYSFASALSMFWPTSAGSAPVAFAPIYLPASVREPILF